MLIKIIFAPIIAILSIGSLFLRFLTLIGGTLLNIVASFLCAITLICVVFSSMTFVDAIPILILCFLMSSYGIPALANWLLDGIDNITDKLKSI